MISALSPAQAGGSRYCPIVIQTGRDSRHARSLPRQRRYRPRLPGAPRHSQPRRQRHPPQSTARARINRLPRKLLRNGLKSTVFQIGTFGTKMTRRDRVHRNPPVWSAFGPCADVGHNLEGPLITSSGAALTRAGRWDRGVNSCTVRTGSATPRRPARAVTTCSRL